LIGNVIHERVWARVGESGAVSWQLGHERLVRVGKRRAELDAEEAVWLVVCEQLRAHRELGFGTFVEYVSAVVGSDAHSAMERIRVARALVGLPATFEKLAAGELSWSAVRELCRVVTPETEGEWLGACASLRVRDIEKMVSGRAFPRGQAPRKQARRTTRESRDTVVSSTPGPEETRSRWSVRRKTSTGGGRERVSTTMRSSRPWRRRFSQAARPTAARRHT
jgi:hypothetical protein